MIDEDKLIDEVNDLMDANLLFYDDASKSRQKTLEEVADLIYEQPKVGEWIPVEERLPENDECVLVSYRSIMKWDKKIYADQIAIRREDGWHWWDGFETEVKNEIVAWQPLPEPYKGEPK